MTTHRINQRQRAGIIGVMTSFAMVIFVALGMLACDAPESESTAQAVQASGETQEFTLRGYMDGYVGVGGEIDGEKNPTLRVNAGDEVTLHFINGENMPHDIAMKGHGIESEMLMRPDEETTISFTAESDDVYYCTVPGHEQAGMIGDLQVQTVGDSSGEPQARLE